MEEKGLNKPLCPACGHRAHDHRQCMALLEKQPHGLRGKKGPAVCNCVHTCYAPRGV